MSERTLLSLIGFALAAALLTFVWWVDTHDPMTYTKLDGGCVIEVENPHLFGTKREVGRACGDDLGRYPAVLSGSSEAAALNKEGE